MIDDDSTKRTAEFIKGLAGHPESDLPGQEANLDLQRGKRIRESGQPAGPGQPPGEKQTFADAVGVLAAMVLGVGGLFIGGGLWGLFGALGLGALGFIVGTFGVMFLESSFKGFFEKRLWRARGHDHTSQKLKTFWEAKFGSIIDERLVDAIDESGTAWVIDRKGNFILRLRSGKKLYVGDDGDGVSVTLPGRKFTAEDAYRLMLGRASAGARTLGKLTGTRRHVALMWAAAKLVGLDVSDHRPDARALQALEDMRRQFPDRGRS